MRIIFGIILGITLIIMAVKEYKKTQDIFSPICFFCLYQFIKYVPNIISETSEWGIVFNDSNMMKVIIIEFVFVLTVIVGYKTNISRTTGSNDELEKNMQVANISSFQIYFLYFIGLAVKIRTIINAGGLGYILSNTANAYISLSSGNGYINSVMYLVFVSFFMMLERIKRNKRKKDVIILTFMIVLYAATDLLFSHRSTTMTIIVILVFGINYLFKRIRIKDFFKPYFLFFITIAVCIMVVMPMYRNAANNVSAEISLSDSIDGIVDRLSMVGRDAFVYEYFGTDNFWFGRSYFNVLVSPIPSSLWNEKPAVDDGMYLVHLMYGYDIEPNESVSNMKLKYSIPFTPQGLLYANFGIIGIIVGGFFTGRIYAYFYKKLLNNNNIYNIALYRIVIIDFAFTTGILVSTIMQCLYVKVMHIINKYRYKKRSN